MPGSLSFRDFSKRIAASFLQSVVVVDDGAFFHEADRLRPHELEKPTRGTKPKKATPPEAGTVTIEDEAHDLDAKALIDAFAEKGLVCSILKPTFQESFEEKALQAAFRADIVSLDWQVQGVFGKDAAGLLQKIVRAAKEQGDRLHLIAIYTADNSLVQIKEKIEETLVAYGEVTKEEDDCLMIQGATRVCIFAKEHNSGVIPADRRLPEGQLPGRLIDEFTKMTMGLLPNAALESLSAIRLNTHRILGKFCPGLDAPYLTHRALLVEPEDAEDYLTSLIAEELRDILEEINIGAIANLNTIKAWLKGKEDSGGCFVLKRPQGEKLIEVKLSQEDICDLLSGGVSKWKCKDIPIGKPLNLALTEMFHGEESSSLSLDDSFAVAATMRSHYGSRNPALTFGAILKSESVEEGPHYWVCLQQPCDCIIRDDGTKRGFVFLPLSPADNSGFNIVVREKDKFLRLASSDNSYDIKAIEFSFPAQFRGSIKSEKAGENYCFDDAKGNRYIWLGELKPEKAQRILQVVGNKFTRVAMDDPEWLRRSSRQPKR